MDFEIDIAQHMLLGVALDALRPIQEGHLQSGGLLRRKAEGLGHMLNLQHHRPLIDSVVFSHRNLGHDSEHLRELGAVLAEHMDAQPQDHSGQHIRQQTQQLVIHHGPHGWHVFRR